MSDWVIKNAEDPLPKSSMLETRYRRYCPDCKGFQSHTVLAVGEGGRSRIVRCIACGGETLFEFQPNSSREWLIPPSFAKAARRFARHRVIEILMDRYRKEREGE